MFLKNCLRTFLFPSICPFCKGNKTNDTLFCQTCMTSLAFWKPEQDYPGTAFFCFYFSLPMQAFYKDMVTKMHPKKISLTTSCYLVQINRLELFFTALFVCNKNKAFQRIGKNLSNHFSVPIVKEKDLSKHEKVLVLENTSIACQSENFLTFSFMETF